MATAQVEKFTNKEAFGNYESRERQYLSDGKSAAEFEA